MSNRELELLNRLRRIDGQSVFPNHFENALISGDREYTGPGQYSQYLGDHHICELYLGSPAGGGIHNWRDYAGRLLRFTSSVHNDVFLIYEEDLTLGLHHSYKRMGDTAIFQGLGGGGALGQIANTVGQGLAAGRRGGFNREGLTTSDVMLAPSRFLETQFYENTGAWKFNTTFTFRFGQYGLWDCLEEVFKPAMSLLAMSAPTLLSGNLAGSALMESPVPTQYGLIMSMGAGILRTLVGDEQQDRFAESILAGFNTLGDQLAKELSEREGAAQFLKSLTVAIGQTYEETRAEAGSRTAGTTATKTRNMFLFQPCVLKGCTAVFSKDKDTAGYPIKATVSLEIETQLPAVTQNLSSVRETREWNKYKRHSGTSDPIASSTTLQENEQRRAGSERYPSGRESAQIGGVDAFSNQ